MSSFYLLYYDNLLVGIITDSELYWYVEEWLQNSDGTLNVVSVNKEQFNIPDELWNFTDFVANYGCVDTDKLEISMGGDISDEL